MKIPRHAWGHTHVFLCRSYWPCFLSLLIYYPFLLLSHDVMFSAILIPGDVELTNMQLKPEALNSLKLPVRVKAGFLGSVKLKVCTNAKLGFCILRFMIFFCNMEEWAEGWMCKWLLGSMEQAGARASFGFSWSDLYISWTCNTSWRLQRGCYSRSKEK